MADARTTATSALDSVMGAGRRRDFLKVAAIGGMGLVLPTVITACNDDPLDPTKEATINFSNDVGALNLAYAIVQMQADFYARITSNRFVGYTSNDSTIIGNVSTSKTNVRTALQQSITAGRITDAVLFNFSTIDFSSRTSVMNTLRTVEDSGVQAVVGALSKVKDPAIAAFLGGCASVLARGAAAIRDVIDADAIQFGGSNFRDSFADVVVSSTDVVEKTITPTEWLAIYKPFYLTEIKLAGV